MASPMAMVARVTGAVLAFMAAANPVMAQTPDVVGEVLDASTGVPIPNVVVELPEIGFLTTTDELGYFEIASVPTAEFVVTVSGLGYQTLRSRVTLVRGDRLEVELTPSPVLLPGVDVVGTSEAVGGVLDPGLPNDHVSSETIRDMEHRVVDLLQVLREKGGPRLHIQQRTGRTGLIEYCVQSTRALGTSRSSCRPALISIDGVITFWPGTPLPKSGLEPAELSASEVLRMRPEDVHDVTFLSPTQAFHRFGEAGRYGALMIRTRRGGGQQ